MEKVLSTVKVFWNEKNYNGKMYFNVKSLNTPYDRGAGHCWNVADLCWEGRNAAMPYLQQVEKAFDLRPSAKKDAVLSFGKYADKKVSEVPASYLRWLVAHSNVLKAGNRGIVEIVKELFA